MGILDYFKPLPKYPELCDHCWHKGTKPDPKCQCTFERRRIEVEICCRCDDEKQAYCEDRSWG